MIFSFEKKRNSFKYRWIDGILNSSYESFTKRDKSCSHTHYTRTREGRKFQIFLEIHFHNFWVDFYIKIAHGFPTEVEFLKQEKLINLTIKKGFYKLKKMN